MLQLYFQYNNFVLIETKLTQVFPKLFNKNFICASTGSPRQTRENERDKLLDGVTRVLEYITNFCKFNSNAFTIIFIKLYLIYLSLYRKSKIFSILKLINFNKFKNLFMF